MKIVDFWAIFHSKSAIFNNNLRVEKSYFLGFLAAVEGCRVFLWASITRTGYKLQEIAKVPVSSRKFPLNSRKCRFWELLLKLLVKNGVFGGLWALEEL